MLQSEKKSDQQNPGRGGCAARLSYDQPLIVGQPLTHIANEQRIRMKSPSKRVRTAATTPAKTAPAKPERSALATLCKACGEQLRLDVLRVLSRDSFAVQELTRIFSSSQPGMSHHLNILLKAGLVTARNEGNSIFYQRAHQALDPLLDPLQTHILQATDLLPLAEEVEDRLAEVRRERAEKARRLFAQNARAIHKLHELIVPFETYGEQVADLVASCFPDGGDTALEVGPGEGAFLPTLAARFTDVVALDLSAEMLAQARALTDSQGLTNIRFLLGDTSHEALAEVGANCVVINMVLHHTPSPAAIFNEVAAAMQQGGVLIVAELVYHDQGWVRESCGHQWLGFQPEDLEQWAEAAGLTHGHSLFLAQRNGFRIQIQQFVKY